MRPPVPAGTRRVQFATAIDVTIVAVVWLGLLALLTGGLRLRVGPFRLSLNDPLHFFEVVVALVAMRLAVSRGALLQTFSRGPLRLAWTIPHLVVALLFFAAIDRAYDPATGFTSLISFGDHFEWRAMPEVRATRPALEHGAGYDGQFYVQLAFDPFLRTQEIRSAVDSLAYRGRRILFPWVVRVVGMGQPESMLRAWALMNVVTWTVLAVLMLRWLPIGNAQTTAAWIACLLNMGLLQSVYSSLTDGPSLLLLALAVVAIEDNRPWLASIVLGISGLGRETNLLGGALLIPAWKPRPPRVRDLVRLAGQAAIAIAPLAIWLWYLTTRALSLRYVGGENVGMVFSGYLAKWVTMIGELRADGGWLATITMLTVAGATIQALALACWYQDRTVPWWRLGVAYAAFMCILGDAVWGGHPGSFPRIILPAAFAFNVMLVGRRFFWPLWLLGNAGLASAVPEMLSRGLR